MPENILSTCKKILRTESANIILKLPVSIIIDNQLQINEVLLLLLNSTLLSTRDLIYHRYCLYYP